MKKDKLGKFYDRFDPDERFRLVLEAAARGDEEDIERLRDTCPRETYSANEIAYSDRISGSLKMTMMLCQLLAPSLTKLRNLAAFRQILSLTFEHCINEVRLAYLRGHERGVSRTWKAAGKKGEPTTNKAAKGGGTEGGGQHSDGSGTGRPARYNRPSEGGDRRFLAKRARRAGAAYRKRGFDCLGGVRYLLQRTASTRAGELGAGMVGAYGARDRGIREPPGAA